MSERIIIGLDAKASTDGAIRQLIDLGAASAAPIEGIPNAILAYVEADRAEEFIRSALEIPGVRHAERDQMRSTY